MSMILRLGRNVAKGALCKPIVTPATAPNRGKFNDTFRYLTQPAMNDEDEEVEIDQRRLPTDYDPAIFDPMNHRSPPTDRVFRLVDEVTGLTLVELQQLKSLIWRKLEMTDEPFAWYTRSGVSGLAAVDMKAATATKEEKKPEKTVFDLKLESIEASSKLNIIKEVRTFTALGLKDAKALVEKLPAVIKTGVSKEAGETFIEKMKAIGAKVVMG